MKQYVQVVVNVPGIEGMFDYHVPPEYQGDIQIGSLILVPFGRQVVQGIVDAFVEIPQVPNTKAISGILDETAVLTPHQQALAKWMSLETLSSLSACYQLMLPAGLSQQADRLYRLIQAPANEPLSPLQKRIVERLTERGAQRGRQLDAAFRRIRWKEPINSLIRRGVISGEAYLPSPRVQAKMVRMVYPVTPVEDLEGKLSEIGRPGKAAERRATVMDFLVQQQQGVEAQVIYAVTGSSLTD